MKNRRWLAILLIVFVAICVLVAGGIGLSVMYFKNQPPSSLGNDSGYYIRGSKVYYLGGFPSEAFQIDGADSSSFKIIDTTYASDSSRVYMNGAPIPNADPTTFQIIHQYFTKDAKYVYLGTDVFSDDPSHFEYLFEPLMRDSKHVYWDTKIMSDDPANLAVISSDYYVYLKDSTSVYIQGNLIEGADPESFSVISDSYAKDKQNIYYFDQMIPNVDAASFEVIQAPYAHDAKHVYWMEKPIEGADPNTFQVLNKNFECTVDKTHAYYEDTVIANADPSTFPANGTVTNCDANGMYFSQ